MRLSKLRQTSQPAFAASSFSSWFFFNKLDNILHNQDKMNIRDKLDCIQDKSDKLDKSNNLDKLDKLDKLDMLDESEMHMVDIKDKFNNIQD